MIIRNNRLSITVIITTNLLGLLFYYSPISLYGYWTDTFFILTVILLTFLFSSQIESGLLRKALKALSIINLIIISFVSFSLFNGVVPVHFISKGHFADNNTYGYFLERGNLGATNGCYGEVQYYKQISWIPFLEFKIGTDTCSSLDYDSIINGA